MKNLEVNRLIVKVLVDIIESDSVDKTITYGDLSDKIDKIKSPRQLSEPLIEISNICKENNLPLLSAIVVGKNGIAGVGFINNFYPHIIGDVSKLNQYVSCLNDVVNYKEWNKLKKIINI